MMWTLNDEEERNKKTQQKSLERVQEVSRLAVKESAHKGARTEKNLHAILGNDFQ